MEFTYFLHISYQGLQKAVCIEQSEGCRECGRGVFFLHSQLKDLRIVVTTQQGPESPVQANFVYFELCKTLLVKICVYFSVVRTR